MAKKTSKGDNGAKKSVAPPAPFMGYPGLDTMRDEMSRMMQSVFAGDWMTNMPRFPGFADWPRPSAEMPFAALMNAPRADMSETEEGYELSIELPGLDEEDIDLTLTDQALTLKGEKKVEKDSKEKDYHFSERSYGSIRRQFPLPSDVDRDALKASFAKGVLKVTLPKTDAAKASPRRIEVGGDEAGNG